MTGDTPSPLDHIRRAINKKFNDPGEASTILANAALAQVEALAEAAQAATLHAARWGSPFPADIERLRAALVPFAAHKDTNHA